MPEPISSAPRPVCDPEIASCVDFPPTESGAVTAAGANVVQLEAVRVTGDAGAQALLRRYDASLACGAETEALSLSCPGIGVAVMNALEGGPLAGVGGALLSSVACGKDLRALSDCYDRATDAAEVIQRCHDLDGYVRAGEARYEIVCEVER